MNPATVVIVGAGYIGLEMADALTTRGLAVIQMEQLPGVLPTVDPPLGALVRAELENAASRCWPAPPPGRSPVASEADDHKAYYPGSHRITMRVTGDRATGRLLGMHLFGHKNAEIAKRMDIAATAIFQHLAVDAISDLDLSYTPPLGSPWEAVQIAAQAWTAGRARPARHDHQHE